MPTYAMFNSGVGIRNGISVNLPQGIVNGSGVGNYILDDGRRQIINNADGATATINKRYINGGSSNWEKTLG